MCEKKLEAAILLLSLQTDLLLNGDANPLQLLANFKVATVDNKELFDAGMDVAQELSGA